MAFSWKFFAATGALLLSTSVMRADSLVGGTTTVTLNSGTVSQLSGLFDLGTISPTALTGLSVNFPIVGQSGTTISHSGGLSLTGTGTPMGAGTTTDVEDFVIDTSTNKISGTVVVNGGAPTSGVTLFDFDSNLALTLDSQLATDLNSIYGIGDATGLAIGTASITPPASTAPTGVTPEPSSLSLLALGLTVVAFGQRRLFAAAE